MALALVVPESLIRGDVLTIAGTDFEVSTDVDVVVQESVSAFHVSFVVASDAGGDFVTADVPRIVVGNPGTYRVSADDGTNQIDAEVEVFQGA